MLSHALKMREAGDFDDAILLEKLYELVSQQGRSFLEVMDPDRPTREHM